MITGGSECWDESRAEIKSNEERGCNLGQMVRTAPWEREATGPGEEQATKEPGAASTVCTHHWRALVSVEGGGSSLYSITQW